MFASMLSVHWSAIPSHDNRNSPSSSDTIYYITTNPQAIQVSIASGTRMNAGNSNGSEIEKSNVYQNKMIPTCNVLTKFNE